MRAGYWNFTPWLELLTALAALTGLFVTKQIDDHILRRERPELNRLLSRLQHDPGVSNFVELMLTDDRGTRITLKILKKQGGVVVLRGEPGIGKSTLLRELTRQLVQERLQSTDEKSPTPLPFFISLADWTGRQSLEAFLRKHWPYGGDPIKALKAGKHIWLLADSLDALDGSLRKLRQLWTWIASQYAPSHITFACRSASYRRCVLEKQTPDDGELSGTVPVRTVDLHFNADDVPRFAQKYLGEQADTFMALVEADPPAWLEENPLCFMVTDPLRLTILMKEFAKPKDGKLSWNHGMLLDLYVQGLWRRAQRRYRLGERSLEAAVVILDYLNMIRMMNIRRRFSKLGHQLQDAWHYRLGHDWHNRSVVHRAAYILWLSVIVLPISIVVLPYIFIREMYSFAIYIRQSQSAGSSLGSLLYSHAGSVWSQSVISSLSLWYVFSLQKRRMYRLYRSCLLAGIVVEKAGVPSLQNSDISAYFRVRSEMQEGHSVRSLAGGPSRGKWNTTKFHDEILVWAGITDAPNALVEDVIDIDPLLAAKCVASGVPISYKTRGTVIDAARCMMLDLNSLDSGYGYTEAEHSMNCAYVLRDICDSSLVPDLIQMLENERSFQDQLVTLIVSYGSSAIDHLLDHLTPGSRILPYVVAALGRIGDEQRSIGPLRNTLAATEDQREQLWLTAALANLGDTTAQARMKHYLQREPEWKSRSETCQEWFAFVETTERADLVDDLIALLADNHLTHFCFAEVVPLQLGQKALSPILKAFCASNDSHVQSVLAETLGKIGNTAAIADALTEQIFHKDEPFRCIVIEALGKLKAKSATEELIRCLQDESPAVREHAVHALREIGDPKAAPALYRLRDDQTPIRLRYKRMCDAAVNTLVELATARDENDDNESKDWRQWAREQATEFYVERYRLVERDSADWVEARGNLLRLDTAKANAALNADGLYE